MDNVGMKKFFEISVAVFAGVQAAMAFGHARDQGGILAGFLFLAVYVVFMMDGLSVNHQ